MASILIFMAAIFGIVFWWLSRQRLMAKPWLEAGVPGNPLGAATPHRAAHTGRPPLPVAKIGLGVFMAVVGALFTLLISAYLMRRHGADWQSLPVPDLLWFNTFVLIASSVALYWAKRAARGGRIEEVKPALTAGGALALIFLLGQALVWRELDQAGYFLARNPANAFFYLLVALHGLHLSGGLVALGRTGRRVWRMAGPAGLPASPQQRQEQLARLRLGVELCAAYWHFLLAVWLLLLLLLSSWADDFVALCGRFLSS